MIWLEVSFSKNEERREDIRRLKLFLKSFDFPSLGAGKVLERGSFTSDVLVPDG